MKLRKSLIQTTSILIIISLISCSHAPVRQTKDTTVTTGNTAADLLDCKRRYNELYKRLEITNNELKKDYEFLTYIERHNKLASGKTFLLGFTIGGGIVGILSISGFIYYMIKK